MSKPVHFAIVRNVIPGKEAEFETAIRAFHAMDTAGSEAFFLSPGKESHEYGILRSFETEDAAGKFYNSAAFREWEKSISSLVDGGSRRNRIHGLSAFFPSIKPPDWKMALVTYLGVVPSVYLSAALVSKGASMKMSATGLVEFLLVNALVVILLTWLVMPNLVRLFQPFLSPKSNA